MGPSLDNTGTYRFSCFDNNSVLVIYRISWKSNISRQAHEFFLIFSNRSEWGIHDAWTDRKTARFINVRSKESHLAPPYHSRDR